MIRTDEHSHGGNLRAVAALAGKSEADILDFSVNLNPLGPPPWLAEAARRGLETAARYPDPDATRAREAACRRFGLPATRFLFADGADSIIHALPSALGARKVLAFGPGYSGYARAASRAGASFLALPLDPDRDFSPDLDALASTLARAPEQEPRLVYLGAPNNPAGSTPRLEALRDLASGQPGTTFALDESFAELAGNAEGALGRLPANCLVLRSLTKTWAMPGFRLGFAEGEPRLLERLRAALPAWPLSSFAEEAALLALADREWPRLGAEEVARARPGLVDGLSSMRGFRVFPSEANFVLVQLPEGGSATSLARGLLLEGIAIRTYSAAEGLDGRWFRVAVRTGPENALLVGAMRRVLAKGGS